MINYYILAAGDGTRFSQAGYYLPKHLLPLSNKTVIGQIVTRVPNGSKLTVVAKQSHRKETVEAIRRHDTSFVWLHNRGGIIHDLLSCDFPDDGEIIINYCDCWLESGIDRFAESCRNRGVSA
jgi:dTDP-glucose pyrophosphorylase